MTLQWRHRIFLSSFTYVPRCTDRAVDFLREHGQESDFLLCVSYDEPHDPYLCPREYWEPYRNFVFSSAPNVAGTLEGKPDYQKVWAGNAPSRDRSRIQIKAPYYFGCNSFVDAQIGRVLDAADGLCQRKSGYYWHRRPWRKDAPAATWSYTGYTRQSENDYEERQLDYATGLPMEAASRRK